MRTRINRLSLSLLINLSLLISLSLTSLNALAAPAPLPQHDGKIHKGVATCATSVCHGKTSVADTGNVQLNEYHLWSNEDYHSRAFQLLRNDASKAMAKALGLASAQTAKICLDCHADNVPTEKRGEKFQLGDGVGCEGCHGGSELWLKSHTDPGATHADNLSKGLYPLSNPAARSALCLSCHMGTRDKFTTHAIMAAGHPRLSFDLDTFTANQPAHYTVDADYIERKRTHPVGLLWAVGQVASAKQQLDLIQAHHLSKSVAAGMMELAIYDCHSCHRGIKSKRGRSQDFSAGQPAGSLRLADHSLDMVAIILQVMAPENYDAFAKAAVALHSQHDKGPALEKTLTELQQQLTALEQTLPDKVAADGVMQRVRKAIAQSGANGRYGDFSSAEQAFLALESLSFGLADRDGLKTYLDKMYKALADETLFQPQGFAQANAELLKHLP
jgi:Cytochrome c554 and c-prime